MAAAGMIPRKIMNIAVLNPFVAATKNAIIKNKNKCLRMVYRLDPKRGHYR